MYVATDIQAGERGAIFVLEPETGKELQKINIAYSPRAAPTIAYGVVYVVASRQTILKTFSWLLSRVTRSP